MLNRKTKQKLNELYNELNMNLANNYKDLAHDALKSLDKTLEQMKTDGEIKEKDYIKHRRLVDDYKTRMSTYHH